MPRPVSVRRFLGATLVVVLLAAASPAAAEPTSPSPATPSSTPTSLASSSPSTASPAPTPTASPRPSDTASSTSSPAARSSATPARKTGERAWPKRVRALADLIERYAGAADRKRLSALAEEDAGAVVFAGCAAPAATTTADAVYFSFDADPAFNWRVTNAAGAEVDRGSGTLEDEEAEFTIGGLGQGDYTLEITVAEEPEPSTTQAFTVVDCITTTVSCKALTFVNPAANPDVLVFYGGPGTDLFEGEEDGSLAELPAGGEVTVRTALTDVGYGAFVLPDFDEDETGFGVSLAGSVESVAIPTDCERPLSTLSVSCVNDHPRLTVTFAREGSDQLVYFTVTNRKGKVVASGSPRDGRSTATDRLPGPGRYTYRSYFEESKAYETLPVEVETCGAAAPAGNTLADTGPPPLLPLAFGAALLAAGAVLLTRRTRPARQAAPHRRPPARGR